MNVNVSGPIGTWRPGCPTQTVERSAWCWRLTSLYGSEIRCTSATPARVRRLRWWKESMSPTSPMMVRTTPLADERLAADALHALDDVRDLLVGGVRGHDDDHLLLPLSRSPESSGGRHTTPRTTPSIRTPPRFGSACREVTSRSDGDVGDLALDPAARRARRSASRRAPARRRRPAGGHGLAPEQHGEERGEDRLHAHDDRAAGGGRWACAQVWPSIASAPATRAM